MPSMIHKYPIIDEVRKSLPKEILDLAIGRSEHSSGLVTKIYSLFGPVLGSLDLAFQRGKQCGVHDAYLWLLKSDEKRAAKKLLKAFHMNKDGDIVQQ